MGKLLTATTSSIRASGAPNSPAAASNTPKQRNFYFINEIVEDLLRRYIWTGCTDVALRDSIMSHASELIRQIIRKQGLHTIYPGQEESSFNDLLQTGWCVTPDTLVFSGSGIRSIGALLPDGDSGDCNFKVFGRDGLHVAEKYIRRPKTRTYKIELKQHYGLEATGDHPLLVLTEDGPEWVAANQLAPGDLIAVQAGQGVFGNDDIIRERPTSRATYEWWPDRITEDLAYVIGLFIAEGCFSDNRVTIYNYDKEVIEFLESGPAGLQFSYNGNGHNRCDRVRFVEFLRMIGVPSGVDCYTKSIPERMLRCSKHIIAAMLRGMFDGDGHSSRYNGEVGYSSSSKFLIDQLRVLLLNFGMFTKTSIAQRGEVVGPKGGLHVPAVAYQLKLSSLESAVFYDAVGFRIQYKQAKRSKLPKKPFRLMDVVTTAKIKSRLGDYTRSAVKNAGYHRHMLKKRTQFTVAIATKLVGDLGITDQFILDRIAEATGSVRTMWLPVSSIGHGVAETVDIRVRDSHNFTANGIITHNCQIERVLYKFRAKPHCRPCYNPDRPNDSALYQPGDLEYGIVTYDTLARLGLSRCRKCGTKFCSTPTVAAKQDTYGGSESVLFRGNSKVFNLWSQVARTVILAHIKKEGRDRKNSPSYREHVINKVRYDIQVSGLDNERKISETMERFLAEARGLCQYNDDFLVVLDALEHLLRVDDRPAEGVIGKLVDLSGLPKASVTKFIHHIRLRSFEITDSPISKASCPNKADKRKIHSGAAADDED